MEPVIVVPSHKRPDSMIATLSSLREITQVPIVVIYKGYPNPANDVADVLDDPNIWFMEQQGGNGPGVAVNQGFAFAIKELDADVVLRVDDDIRVHKGKYNIVQTFLNAFEANPKVGIVSAWNRSLAWRQRSQPKLARMTNPAQCVGFRVESLMEVQKGEGKYFDERYQTREDTELTIRHFIAGWECAVVDHQVTYDHVAPAYGADSTFAQARNDGVEVKMCNQLAAQYDFVRVSAHPKRPDLRRVSYLPQLRKIGIVPTEFEWEDFELALRE